MTLFVRTEPNKGFNEFCEALQKRATQLVGAGVQIMESSGRGRKSLRVKPGAIWGASGLKCSVAGGGLLGKSKQLFSSQPLPD